MKFSFLWWDFTIEKRPKPAKVPQPKRAKHKRFKPEKCFVTDKVMMPEALAKLRAKQIAPKTPNKYMRAYRCQFCEAWHLTHKRFNW